MLLIRIGIPQDQIFSREFFSFAGHLSYKINRRNTFQLVNLFKRQNRLVEHDLFLGVPLHSRLRWRKSHHLSLSRNDEVGGGRYVELFQAETQVEVVVEKDATGVRLEFHGMPRQPTLKHDGGSHMKVPHCGHLDILVGGFHVEHVVPLCREDESLRVNDSNPPRLEVFGVPVHLVVINLRQAVILAIVWTCNHRHRRHSLPGG